LLLEEQSCRSRIGWMLTVISPNVTLALSPSDASPGAGAFHFWLPKRAPPR
jgi:hypothetical protein